MRRVPQGVRRVPRARRGLVHPSAQVATPEGQPTGSVGRLVGELALAEGLQRRDQPGGRIEYSRSSRPVVLVTADRVAFRLRKDVARAALTTPGTSADPGGPEWIALESNRSDRFSLDRARAWFDFAVRLGDAERTVR